jgi:hypothetical protein
MALYYYSAVSAFIFLVVALAHLVRLFELPVQIGPLSISMSLSWLGFVVAALLAIWGLILLDTMHIRAGI